MEKKTRNSKPKIDLTGQHFGRWTALEYVKPGKWKCQCSCENHTIKLVEGRNLRGGKTLSCGCLQKERTSKANSKDLTGQKFGLLTAKERIVENGITYYLCDCDCGNKNIKVDGRNLGSNHTSSCGCIKSKGETAVRKWLDQNNILYEREKTFIDCKGDNDLLKFDFYLPDYNILIEYDGEQHFILSRWGNTTKEEAVAKLEKQKRYDEIKNQWAKNNNVLLFRITYKDFKIIDKKMEDILNGRINDISGRTYYPS